MVQGVFFELGSCFLAKMAYISPTNSRVKHRTLKKILTFFSALSTRPTTRIMYIVLLVTIGLHGLQGDKPVLCISIIIPGDISKYQISNMVGGLTTKAAPFVKKAEKELEASTIKLKFAEWNFASNINELSLIHI